MLVIFILLQTLNIDDPYFIKDIEFDSDSKRLDICLD
jgi:hypothetical protein